MAFNATAVLKSNGTGAVGATSVTTPIAGDEIVATVPASLLPSHGFADQDYTWALWAIDSYVAGLHRNADFVPDANIGVSAVPERANMALLAAGLGLLGFVARAARVSRRAESTPVDSHRDTLPAIHRNRKRFDDASTSQFSA